MPLEFEWDPGPDSHYSVIQILNAKLSMNYQVVTKTVSSQPLAAVRRRVRIGEVGRAWKPALDLVWEFLSQQKGLRTDGHNCFLYHHPAPDEAEIVVDFGV